MSRKTVAVNIYNFIRMSHTEPTRFIEDDFDTIRNQIITVKQYGFRGTYALKYDALMEPRYQELLRQYLDDQDELSAWWEISRELCDRSGVRFRSGEWAEEYDDRVDSAYSIGYSPEERKRLVDGYMADFYAVFGKYPLSIGSWVLDSVTVGYAREKYGIEACCICRDQMGVDGFTLWGGYPNGAYYPSRFNENIPAQTLENQLDCPMFRLLGPDPIYNFEADVREDLQGVYTLEPAWIIGRDPKWLNWFFGCLSQEDAIGMGYAHVGQENNFLWENIRPGFAPQLELLRTLQREGKLRVETMAQTARRFRRKHRLTPPMTFQASRDWSSRNLSCQWYACAAYRLGLLGEEGRLRIRDWFVYDEKYRSRYLESPMQGTKSNFDALPVLFPQLWKKELGTRPFVRLLDDDGQELTGEISYESVDSLRAVAVLRGNDRQYRLLMEPQGFLLEGGCCLSMDALPVFSSWQGKELHMTHRGFAYSIRIDRGTIIRAGADGALIAPEGNGIYIRMGAEQTPESIFTPKYCEDPDSLDLAPVEYPVPKLKIPALAPECVPGDSVFRWGEEKKVTLLAKEEGQIRYTLDGSEPDQNAALYAQPLLIARDTLLKARLFTPDGRVSEVGQGVYRFCLKDMTLESPTRLDARPVLGGNGIADLLGEQRGSLDYLDGQWRATLEDMDVTCQLPEKMEIAAIAMGFLSHHRSGIVYPQRVELYLGEDAEGLRLAQVRELPCQPGQREIEKMDVSFTVGEKIGAFRIIARRYPRMPQWCCYRGTETVFTLADKLLVTPR